MRRVKPLTDREIKPAKPREKEYALWDGGGLHIIIKPNGSKLWRFQFVMAGKKRLMGLGEYPAVSLAVARDKAHDLRGFVAAGIDPVAQRREEEEQRRASIRTFKMLADEWYPTKEGGYRRAHQKKVRWLLRLLSDSFKEVPIDTIRYRHLNDLLQGIVKKGNVPTAHKLGSKAREVFSFAKRQGYIDSNPADDFKADLPPIESKHHAHILDESKLGALLRVIDDYQEGVIQVRYALKILPYLALRAGELRGARWEEIHFDEKLWIVPAERFDKDDTGMKKRVPHAVPLPTQVMELFQDLRQFTGDGPLCFPSPVGKKSCQPISDNTMRAALRRMGYSNSEVTSHGFRHTFDTLANRHHLAGGLQIEAAISHKTEADAEREKDWIRAVLAKKSGNAMRDTYNHDTYIEPRRKLMQAWADFLDGLKAPKD